MFMSKVSCILHALACPTRFAVYQSVGEAGRPVGHLARELGLAQSTVSHHLGVLRRAQLVEFVRRGREHRYRWGRRKWFLVQGKSEDSEERQ